VRGITWDHPRGFAPLLATAASFREVRSDVDVRWEARSLEDFAHFPIDRLASEFDLIVFDHPSCGVIAETGCFVSLETLLDEDVLTTRGMAAVGPSHASYSWNGQQLGLGIDAACHVAAFRPDLIDRRDLPHTWEDVFRLAAVDVSIAMPLFPTDCFCAFVSIAASLGADPFGLHPDALPDETAIEALILLERLSATAHPLSWNANPIMILDAMAGPTGIALCPLLFGYSNYSRPGFRPSIVEFAPPPTFTGTHERMILGGAGIGVSARVKEPEAIAAYLSYLTASETQCGIYAAAEGQPVDRAAWTDDRINGACSSFFANTLEVIEHAYVRPRHPRMIEIQQACGRIVHRFLRGASDVREAASQLASLA
jgi:multiple sugar transport system substrate-binding protein